MLCAVPGGEPHPRGDVLVVCEHTHCYTGDPGTGYLPTLLPKIIARKILFLESNRILCYKLSYNYKNGSAINFFNSAFNTHFITYLTKGGTGSQQCFMDVARMCRVVVPMQ